MTDILVDVMAEFNQVQFVEGQKEIPFSSRLDCVDESIMLDKLSTVDILVSVHGRLLVGQEIWDDFLVLKRGMQRII